jgi:prepilin-type N-terminal cleavage/methylation domain-containing protein
MFFTAKNTASNQRSCKLETSVRGFTLIELLITISIIAIISAVGIINYAQTQKIARDAKRKSDLRELKVALELYYQQNKRYPCVTGVNYSSQATDADPWWIKDTNCSAAGGAGVIQFNINYINNLPIDPLKKPNDTLGLTAARANTYGYKYDNPAALGATSCITNANQYFLLTTRLENASDPDRCENKNYLMCDGSALCPKNAAGKVPDEFKNLYFVTAD